MAKYKNTLEELHDTRNFAKLATVYRYLAKFRDGIAAAAPNTPGGALDPTLKHLDKTLKDYRDLASEISGYPVQDSDLRVNLGDEFGAAGTPQTPDHASSEASKIDVLRELASAQPFDEKDLTAWDISSVAVTTSNASALYGTTSGGALSLTTKASMGSREGEYTWDAMSDLQSYPIVAEARGCVDRILLRAAVAGGLLAAIVIAAFCVVTSGGDEDNGVVIGDAASTPAGGAGGVFAGFSIATREDLAFLDVGVDAGVSYVEMDAKDDAFNSFGDDVAYENPLTELVASYGGRFKLNEEGGRAFTCGEQTSTGMSVVCAEGVTGALPAGDYIVLIGSVEQPFGNWNAAVEYKYSAFIEDRGRTLAFPEGDPRPQFPYNTLIRTNSYASLGSIGGEEWNLTSRWSGGQQFQPWPDSPATDNAERYVRAALGGNTFMFVAPSELYSDMTYYNVGTEAHPAGEDYTAQNTRQDVLGANPQGMKPQIINLRGMGDDEDGPTIIGLMRERLDDYAQWVSSGDGPGLDSHLDRSALLRWGEQRCTDYWNRVAPDPTFELEVLDARGPVTWDWEVYGLRVGTLFDAYEFDVNVTQGGVERQATVHFAWDEGAEDIRIFSPCVTPEEGAAEAAASQAPPSQPPPAGAPASGAAVDQIRALIPGYEAARRAGSDDVFDYLHPVVMDYYGEDVCRDFYANTIQPDPTFAFGAETRVSGPAAYTYMPGGVTVGSADDVYSFVMDTTIGGATQPFTWRFALIEGKLKTFQPCRR